MRTALDLDKGLQRKRHTSDEELPVISKYEFSLTSSRDDCRPPGEGSQLVIHP
jgi:hypothetical protein